MNGTFDLSLAAQDSPSSIRAMHTLFSVPAPPAQDGEHAKKRRKTDNGSAVRMQQTDFDADASVVLARISLDLVSINIVS
jgi:E3 ubiquitin-protein ligase SHPRH